MLKEMIMVQQHTVAHISALTVVALMLGEGQKKTEEQREATKNKGSKLASQKSNSWRWNSS